MKTATDQSYYNRCYKAAYKFLSESMADEYDPSPHSDDVHELTSKVISAMQALNEKRMTIGITGFATKEPISRVGVLTSSLRKCPQAGDRIGVWVWLDEFNITVPAAAIVEESIPGQWAWDYAGAFCSSQSHQWQVRLTGFIFSRDTAIIDWRH